ncbi:MAG: hypothetical protein CSA79_00545 [Thiothrix nivea]|nr:MAG: hypothetical protein CSA79_00545 [Thiothrix nivea]
MSIQTLQAHMLQHIGVAIDNPVIDGRWHSGRGKGKDKVSYVGHHLPKGMLVRYRHWQKSGEECFTWKEWADGDIRFNASEYQRRKAESDRKAVLAAKQADNERARILAICHTVMGESIPASPEHPYLSRKCIFPNGARQSAKRYQVRPQTHESPEQYIPEGALIIPIHDRTGNLQGIYQINDDGRKIARGTLKGGSLWIGGGLTTGEVPNRIYIAEGYATAVSVHMRTRNPVVACFSTSNLLPIGKELRQQYPNAELIYAADNDIGSFIQIGGRRIENPGKYYAEQAARSVSASVVLPLVDGVKSDWNDWHCLQCQQKKACNGNTGFPF